MLADAAAIDDKYEAGESITPLCGLPLAVKDAIDVLGQVSLPVNDTIARAAVQKRRLHTSLAGLSDSRAGSLVQVPDDPRHPVHVWYAHL